ncbi:hypothetical protein [Streptomyces pseudovenezuelae]|uniref:Acyl-CoA dehydrogenase C-terminal domain-containing protein n=1 Tax=Streptomyces pseudovenezuelae TaxID=67350 RepID=A0ABZ1WQ57_9ACTN|nr:hypothetical protein [Streptomyces pseudovenezuelae]
MYAGRAPSFFHGEQAAVMIGIAYAAADAYARIVAARPLLMDPDRTRSDLHDYQRHLGESLGVIHMAEALLRQTAEDWMEACRRNVSGEAPQGILFRTVGSRHARDGERMQRYFRDAATYWTHVHIALIP